MRSHKKTVCIGSSGISQWASAAAFLIFSSSLFWGIDTANTWVPATQDQGGLLDPSYYYCFFDLQQIERADFDTPNKIERAMAVCSRITLV